MKLDPNEKGQGLVEYSLLLTFLASLLTLLWSFFAGIITWEELIELINALLELFG